MFQIIPMTIREYSLETQNLLLKVIRHFIINYRGILHKNYTEYVTYSSLSSFILKMKNSRLPATKKIN